ncbi:tetrapyrrole (corrin/porphyrin) methylase family protein [gut metagenome]|uniref:Tetrapyrrole (Corrin/porphyrin) methylase family protein n=1 Tax=gut metagenome TaxID=749906 RepID=J9GF75_9ZZZZ
MAVKKRALVLYEAPHRVLDLLKDLAMYIAPSRRVIIAREITKKFETFSSLKGETLPEWIKTHNPKGEYVILIDESPEEKLKMSEETIAWLGLLAKEMPVSRLSSIATKATGLSREELYRYICDLK